MQSTKFELVINMKTAWAALSFEARLHMKKGNEDGTEFRSLHSVYCRERRKRDSCGGLMGS